MVKDGRVEFLSQFRSLAQPEMQDSFADPGSPSTFHHCKLDFAEREQNAEWYSLHKDLLRLRKDDVVFRVQRRGGLDGAVLGPQAFVLRFWGENGQDRLLIVNFGQEIHLDPAPEPLLSPPEDTCWTVLWSSEDRRYGGGGTAPVESEENWRIPGHAAVALVPGQKENGENAC
jgi:maltooligosyltrehalose trehalohydrolase